MDALPFWDSLQYWLTERHGLLILTVASVVMFFGSLVLFPVVVVRLPPDFFNRSAQVRAEHEHPVLFWSWKIIKNFLGLIFLTLGLVMLFTPGQGLLAIIVGVALLDVPGKREVLRRLVARPRIFHALNSLRERAGREPFEPPARKERRRKREGAKSKATAPSGERELTGQDRAPSDA